ncbi:MAG TPA: amidase [Usitatibacter sp.]|nr:amidase [Usitatibacter sp.]
MSEPDDPTRRDFLAATAAGTLASLAVSSAEAAGPSEPASKFTLEEASLASLARRMQEGTATAKSLAEAYLARIAALDRAGPQLRAVIELNPEALAIAEALDRERKAGRLRGPLHGIPILVKDNIPSGDRMSTTAGSLVLDGRRARADAPVLKRLRDAGVVLLGKTNLSEWANFRSTNSLSGWSSRGGQTRNPYALERSPSGSSSGSAVAVAANLCAAAIGTETDGSIVSPSSCNNIVGFKPSIGLVSRTGIIPIAHSQDTAGPMARSVADCALLMNAMAAADREDPSTTQPNVPRDMDFTRHLGLADLKGVRIGVARQYFTVNEKVDALLEAALARLRELGAELVDVEIPGFGKFGAAELEVLLYEFKAGLNAWLVANAKDAPAATLAQLIEYNEKHRERMMPLFGQNLLERAQAKGPLTEPEYVKALETCREMTRKQGIDAVVEKHKVEAIVAPTTSPPWIMDPVTGDSGRGGSAGLAAVAGYPNLTVPAGFIVPPPPFKGVAPVGMSFFGPAFSDARILAIGAAFERATRHRRAPSL